MKRQITKFKHKLAWHFRKWANQLEPQVTAPHIPPPLTYRGKEYKLTPLRLEIDFTLAWGDPKAMEHIYNTAARQIGVAASTRVEIVDREYADGDGRAIAQLLILEPKDNESKRG